MAGVLTWLVVVELLGLGSLPLALRAYASSPVVGLTCSKILSLVVVGYVCWAFSMLGVTAFDRATLVVGMMAIAGVAWRLWGRETLAWLRASRTTFLVFEALFLGVLGVATFIRAFNADILGQEKFMDYALMNTFLTAAELPAEDPWLAGYAVPYYHLGYLILGVPTKIATAAGPIAYNLTVAFVLAATFVGVAGVVYTLVSRDGGKPPGPQWRALGYGVLGATLVTVLGNLEAALELAAAIGLGGEQLWRAVGVRGLSSEGLEPPLSGAWWWRASRVIPNIQPDGITEFPYFSFILGDLHPHYMALPIDVALVGLGLSISLRRAEGKSLAWLLATAVVLGALLAANTWDVPLFWGVILGPLLMRAWMQVRRGGHPIGSTLLVVSPFVLAVLLISPYFFGYSPQRLGLGFVGQRTPAVSLLILFGPYLAVAALFAVWIPRVYSRLLATGERTGWLGSRSALVLVGAVLLVLAMRGEGTLLILTPIAVGLAWAGWCLLEHSDRATPAVGSLPANPLSEPWERGLGREGIGLPARIAFCWFLTSLGVATLIAVEIVYLHDLFGSRMNTVFKFHYDAWLLLGIASASAIGLIREWRSNRRGMAAWRVASAAALLLFVPGLLYPLMATWSKSGSFRGEATLDGARFLRRSWPADAEAIQWLQANSAGRPVVVEAVGPDYQEFGRVSTFAGLPTVIGWIGHEAQWRGERIDYGRRERDVDAMYRSGSVAEIMRLARPYRARYIFFGALERDRYGDEALQRLSRLLPPAYARGGTVIFTIPGDSESPASG